ncbi:hypothetical protein BGZ97_003609 [Linnemannia gamsii]|uniref:Transmembrane protein n=1 Tax=Linnemannia gamsii TaxID=64522 RepID=A0A9P6QUV4_9FUNG|nr:hypothetical protein BGZ97_003609 [Linnemannia gamsii]
MFLPWSFFMMNLFFVALDLLVAVALGAALTHISRRTEGYAHSIRWIQQAGYYEMFTALRLSAWRRVGGKPLLALFATFTGSIALTAILVGAKTFAIRGILEGEPSYEVVSSRQFIASNVVTSLPAWVIPINSDTTIQDALTKAVNGSRSIPQANRSSKWYQPQLSAYEVACNRFDFMASYNLSLRLLNESSCATVNIYATGSGDEVTTESYIVPRSHDRGKVFYSTRSNRLLTEPKVFDLSIISHLGYKEHLCGTLNYNFQLINTTRVGLTSTPKTVLTKCLFTSGEMVSMASTTVRFLVPNQGMFQSTATAIFGDQNELVLAMQESVDNGTLTNLPIHLHVKHTVMEVKISGTEVAVLLCVGSRELAEELPHVTCGYTIINALIAKSRAMDPDIARLLLNKGHNPINITVTNMMTLHHLPSVWQDKKPSFEMSKILNASLEASDYVARLGQSFVVDWNASMLHIAFDTVKILEGYEVPGWLILLMVGVMLVCLVFWAATEYWAEGKYKRSLYFAVSKELTKEEAKTKPRLHKFDTDTLRFEGRRIVAAGDPVPASDEEEKI